MRKIIPLFLVLLCIVPAQAAIPPSNEIVFEIFRNGSKFGEHSLAFKKDAAGQTVVDINIEMKYCAGPICFFRYNHTNQEVWKGDKIISMISQTYDDGTDYNVKALWDQNAVRVTANGESYEGAPQMLSTSYWNKAAIQSKQLINTQKGDIENIQVTYHGQKSFQTAVETLQADKYSIQASVPITIWYDSATKQWVGLKFAVRGSEIEYKRQTLVSATEKSG